MKAVVYACMANGLEEVECLAAVDVMSRCVLKDEKIGVSGFCSFGGIVGRNRQEDGVKVSGGSALLGDVAPFYQ